MVNASDRRMVAVTSAPEAVQGSAVQDAAAPDLGESPRVGNRVRVRVGFRQTVKLSPLSGA